MLIFNVITKLYFCQKSHCLETQILLITPPFTQLNTPYPGTVYLKGFLNTKNISSYQSDLGMEVILELFSKKGLQNLFEYIDNNAFELGENAQRIVALKDNYVQSVDAVISFLQGKIPHWQMQLFTMIFCPKLLVFL